MNNVIHHPAFGRDVIANGRRRGNYPRNVTRMDAYIRRHAYEKALLARQQLDRIEDLDRERKSMLEARAYLEKGQMGDALRGIKEMREGYMRLSFDLIGLEHEIQKLVMSNQAMADARAEADAIVEAQFSK